jgi:hypothetical protein
MRFPVGATTACFSEAPVGKNVGSLFTWPEIRVLECTRSGRRCNPFVFSLLHKPGRGGGDRNLSVKLKIPANSWFGGLS